MSVDQLRQLVQNYMSGEVDYASFRREFVLNFLSARHDDALIDRLGNAIESLCSDFSQQHIADELSLKSALARTALAVTAHSVQAGTRLEIVFDPIRPSIALSDQWWAVANVNSVTFSPSIPVGRGTRNDDNRTAAA